jgi:hypothetical protein
MAELEVTKVNEETKEQIDSSTAKKGPTPEEVSEYKKEFNDKAQGFAIKEFQIGSEENAENIVNYLDHFIKYRFTWTKNAWMGVVKMNEEIELARTRLTENRVFKLGYQALEFAFYAIENPSGIGFESAQIFEKENVEFGIVHESLAEALKSAREELKEIQFLQDRWAAGEQGFYFEREPPKEEETPEEVK